MSVFQAKWVWNKLGTLPWDGQPINRVLDNFAFSPHYTDQRLMAVYPPYDG